MSTNVPVWQLLEATAAPVAAALVHDDDEARVLSRQLQPQPEPPDTAVAIISVCFIILTPATTYSGVAAAGCRRPWEVHPGHLCIILVLVGFHHDTTMLLVDSIIDLCPCHGWPLISAIES